MERNTVSRYCESDRTIFSYYVLISLELTYIMPFEDCEPFPDHLEIFKYVLKFFYIPLFLRVHFEIIFYFYFLRSK